jgi:hypothetical protein
VDVLPYGGWRAQLAAWRNGFSTRRMVLAAAAEIMAANTALVESGEAWRIREPRLAAVDAGLRTSSNPATRMFPSARDHELERRKVLGRLRLLRLGLAWHAGAELPTLDDPLGGGPLRVRADGASAQFSSEFAALSRTARR